MDLFCKKKSKWDEKHYVQSFMLLYQNEPAQKRCKILLKQTKNSQRPILPDSDQRKEDNLLITELNSSGATPPHYGGGVVMDIPPQQPPQLQEPEAPLNPPYQHVPKMPEEQEEENDFPLPYLAGYVIWPGRYPNPCREVSVRQIPMRGLDAGGQSQA